MRRCREELAVAPVEHQELNLPGDAFQLRGAEQAALQPVGGGGLAKHFTRQADLARLGRVGDAGAEVHRIAADGDAVGQHRAPVRSDAQPQLVLARARRIRPRHRRLQLHERADRAVGRGKREECPIACRVDEPALMPGETFAHQVDVQ